MQVVLGKGPIGRTTARRLAGMGVGVRLISRTAGTPEPGIEPVALDATDADALTTACRGADVIYQCASPAYHRWPRDWPPLAEAVFAAATATSAVLVLVGNLYGYGPADAPFTEDMPLAATGPKGRVRAELWRRAMAEHRAGRLRVTEARASDYFGPGVTLGHLADRMVPRILAGKPVSVLGDPDAPHSWTYLPDIADALVCLGADERAWGHAWHVPTSPAYSSRAAAERIRAVVDAPAVRVRAVPWPMMRALGLVVPPLRGMSETRYQFDHPFLVDSTRYTATFGGPPTPAADAIRDTAEWWRSRRA